MPQTVGVKQAIHRGEVKQLQAHRQDNPGNNHSRPSSPGFLEFSVPVDTIGAPRYILYDSSNDISDHVVCIVPSPQSKIGDMTYIQDCAYESPKPEKGRFHGWLALIESKNPDRCVVKSVEYTRAGSEVIKLLGNVEITRVENHAEAPADYSHGAKYQVIFPQRIAGRYVLSDL